MYIVKQTTCKSHTGPEKHSYARILTRMIGNVGNITA